MKPYQQRVQNERDELVVKIVKLGEFLPSETLKSLDILEQGRLIKQHEIMKDYCAILDSRIAAFTE